MGRLVSWGWVAAAFDLLPGELPPAERTVVLILAEDARRGSRRSSPGLPKLLARSGLKSRSQLAAVLGKLADRGLIRQIERARRGHVAVYELLFDEARFEETAEMGPAGRTQASPDSPTGEVIASGGADADREDHDGLGSGGPDADTEVTGELRPVGRRIASGGPDPSLASSLELQAAAEPTDDEPDPPTLDAEEPTDAVEADPYADLAGRLVVGERLPASWRPDIAAALARGCAPAQIVDAYRAPLSGPVRSPAAVRRRRIRDLEPAPAAASSAVTPTPPNLRNMCRLHTQPAPCPVCADHAADASGRSGPVLGAPRAATGAALACTRSPATADAIAALRVRLPRGRR
ncbi:MULTISPECIES: hypothetical protein [unclassified Frankia]|uniref:hypothetical protein n=1 Tax=unclassified Frankia TaxID=2632575 RepID=UPI001112E663|nr:MULTISPECIES: hypothetical protein [unclassified Frankia]